MLHFWARRTGSLVAAVGRSSLDKGIKAGSIIKAAAKAAEASLPWPRAEGPNVEKLDEALRAGKEAMRAGA